MVIDAGEELAQCHVVTTSGGLSTAFQSTTRYFITKPTLCMPCSADANSEDQTRSDHHTMGCPRRTFVHDTCNTALRRETAYMVPRKSTAAQHKHQEATPCSSACSANGPGLHKLPLAYDCSQLITPGSACRLAVDTVTAMQQAAASQLPQNTTVALHSAAACQPTLLNPLGTTEAVSATVAYLAHASPAPPVKPLVPKASTAPSVPSGVMQRTSIAYIRVDQHTEVRHYITATMMLAQTGDGNQRCHKRNDRQGEDPLAIQEAPPFNTCT